MFNPIIRNVFGDFHCVQVVKWKEKENDSSLKVLDFFLFAMYQKRIVVFLILLYWSLRFCYRDNLTMLLIPKYFTHKLMDLQVAGEPETTI